MIEIFRLIDYSGLAHSLPIIIDEDVAHYGEDPSLEIDIVDIFVFIIKSLQGCILKKILCLLPVCGELVCETKKIAL